MTGTAFQRYFQTNFTTSSSITVPNRDGSNYIALGPGDQTGGVIITPQYPGDLSGQPAFVGVGSPVIAPMRGPFTITVPTVPLTNAAAATNLDLFVYQDIPVQAQKRSLYTATGTLVNNSQFDFPMTGRRRISIFLFCTAGTPSVRISVPFSTTAQDLIIFALNSAGTAKALYELNSDVLVAASVATGSQVPTNINVLELGASGAASATTYLINASDDI